MRARVKLDETKPKSREDEEAGLGMRWTSTEDRHEIQVGYRVDHQTEIRGKELKSIQR